MQDTTLGKIRDLLSGRTDWFALYAIDQRLDDETYCDQVRRGNFRLHPKGALGRSEGCVVIDQEADFRHLRMVLTSVSPVKVTGTNLKVYGTLQVS
ncbi:tlde1 domain-containing protein [Herbaspirillum sp. GCM10030257]|uniref:tlde1 domain-containing protein n=1 Tax=Herbaspirillum sp. GCM10030257 TaxID=3273393 RepID=UPI0036222547